MEISHAILRIPPYHGGGQREIVRRPRIFAFDTGLVAHIRGWETLREDDRGLLWENLVLDELRAVTPHGTIHYWRDKSRREIDFIVAHANGAADAVEAKINPEALDPAAFKAFRALHPRGTNYLICPFAREPHTLGTGGLTVEVRNTPHPPVRKSPSANDDTPASQ